MKIGTFTQEELGYIGYIDTAGLRVADVRFIRMPVKQGSGPHRQRIPQRYRTPDSVSRGARAKNLRVRAARAVHIFAVELMNVLQHRPQPDSEFPPLWGS
jgi:hypothetical protein